MSCHARLASHEGSKAGPATAELRHEHQVILRALAVLERAAARLDAGRPVDEAALSELVDLLQTYADRLHHGKEEARLFPLLRERGPGATLAVFLEEHDEGRGYLRRLARPGPPAGRAAAARRYVGLLRDHIQREDEVLFPMADEALTLDEHDRLAVAYRAVEAEVLGAGGEDRVLAALDRLEATVPA
jgi:hemerythrin-like domain-containing protein